MLAAPCLSCSWLLRVLGDGDCVACECCDQVWFCGSGVLGDVRCACGCPVLLLVSLLRWGLRFRLRVAVAVAGCGLRLRLRVAVGVEFGVRRWV